MQQTPQNKDKTNGWVILIVFAISCLVLYGLFTDFMRLEQFPSTIGTIVYVVLGVIAFPAACYSGMLLMASESDWFF